MEVTMFFILLGGLLTIGGLLSLVRETIWRGPLSGPIRRRTTATLEPRAGGFALAKYWPGLALMALGAILMLAGANFLNPEPALVR